MLHVDYVYTIVVCRKWIVPIQYMFLYFVLWVSNLLAAILPFKRSLSIHLGCWPVQRATQKGQHEVKIASWFTGPNKPGTIEVPHPGVKSADLFIVVIDWTVFTHWDHTSIPRTGCLNVRCMLVRHVHVGFQHVHLPCLACNPKYMYRTCIVHVFEGEDKKIHCTYSMYCRIRNNLLVNHM